MAPYLRKVIHPQAHENYRVILKGHQLKRNLRSNDACHGI
jgi:hypothetical protein